MSHHSQVASAIDCDVAECRICGDEASISDLDSPCGCTGSCRWAHASCVQKWIDLKPSAAFVCEVFILPVLSVFTLPPRSNQLKIIKTRASTHGTPLRRCNRCATRHLRTHTGQQGLLPARSFTAGPSPMIC